MDWLHLTTTATTSVVIIAMSLTNYNVFAINTQSIRMATECQVKRARSYIEDNRVDIQFVQYMMHAQIHQHY